MSDKKSGPGSITFLEQENKSATLSQDGEFPWGFRVWKVLAWTDWSCVCYDTNSMFMLRLGHSSHPVHSFVLFCVLWLLGNIKQKCVWIPVWEANFNAALISYNSDDKSTFTGFSVIEQFVLGFTDDWTCETRIGWGIWGIFGKRSSKARVDGW